MKYLFVLIFLLSLCTSASARDSYTAHRALAPDTPHQPPSSAAPQPRHSSSGSSSTGPYIDQSLGAATPGKVDVIDPDNVDSDDSARRNQWRAADAARSQQDFAASNVILHQEMQPLCPTSSVDVDCLGGDFTPPALGEGETLSNAPDPTNVTPAPQLPSSREDLVADLMSVTNPRNDIPTAIDGESLRNDDATSLHTVSGQNSKLVDASRRVDNTIREFTRDSFREAVSEVLEVDLSSVSKAAKLVDDAATLADPGASDDKTIHAAYGVAQHFAVNSFQRQGLERSETVTADANDVLNGKDPSQALLEITSDSPLAFIKDFPVLGKIVQNAQSIKQTLDDETTIAGALVQAVGNGASRSVQALSKGRAARVLRWASSFLQKDDDPNAAEDSLGD